MSELITTLGSYRRGELGLILPHEHIFVDLGPIEEANYAAASAGDVIPVMRPYIEDAMAAGVTALVECTPEGVGRRLDIDQAVSEATGLPVVLPTGIYREPYMPDWVYDASVDEIADFFRDELENGVGETGVPAGWIKLSQNGTGMTLTERKILEAACIVAQETGAAIGSHLAIWGSSAGPTALSVIDALEGFGCPLDEQRFIWIHAGVEAGASGSPTEVADLVSAAHE